MSNYSIRTLVGNWTEERKKQIDAPETQAQAMMKAVYQMQTKTGKKISCQHRDFYIFRPNHGIDIDFKQIGGDWTKTSDAYGETMRKEMNMKMNSPPPPQAPLAYTTTSRAQFADPATREIPEEKQKHTQVKSIY